MNFIFFVNNRKDCSKSIVQSISFHNELSIRNPMSKNRSRGECLFERIEGIMTGRVKLPRDILPGKACQWNNNVWIVKDKLVIKISKTYKGLNILDFLRLWLVLNNLYFIIRYGKTWRRKNVFQILYWLRVEFAFLYFNIKTSLAKMLKYFLNMLVIFRHVIRVNEYII